MVQHHTSSRFWECYSRLPLDVRESADKCFALLKFNSRHPSLHFKKIDKVWSVRVGRSSRALAKERPEGLLWFWIGPHTEYERLLGRI